MGNQRHLLALSENPPMAQQEVDVRDVSSWAAIMGAFETIFMSRDKDVLRAVGPAPMGGDFVEIVLEMGPLRKAMLRFSVNVLLLSLIISAITAALVYLALHYLLVRPMRRITANMMAFRADPENPSRIIAPSARQDEVGLAERELASMQGDLASMLHQKSRLAALGLAVSKINHDLRNLLASAQLFSEGLSHLPDPRVQRFAPKLMRSLERAIELCQSTLSYGRAQEPPPVRKVDRAGAAGRGGARDAGARRRGADRLDRRDRARHEGRCRPRPAPARAAQPDPQRAAGAGERARRTIRCATRSASPDAARARWR